MVSDRQWKKKKVCVIGAGPSGLVAARELTREGHKVVVFEQNHDVGGQWLYDPNVQNQHHIVHSSIYASLRLTSPREIMGFTDFPFVVKKGRDTRRFPGHRELFLYLKDFCDCFGLRDMIRFNTRVEYVGIIEQSHLILGKQKHIKWIVRSRSSSSSDNTIDEMNMKMVDEVFDAVVVASGHYSHPRLPTIKGTLNSYVDI